MRNHPGRAIAVGILCSIAASVGLWSGALASASGALHAGGQSPVQVPRDALAFRPVAATRPAARPSLPTVVVLAATPTSANV